MFALNHTSIFHLHRRKCAMPSRSSSLPALRNGRLVVVSTPLLLMLPPPSRSLHIFYSLIILLILSANKNNGKSTVLCDAAATISSVAVPLSQISIGNGNGNGSGNGSGSGSISASDDRNTNNHIDDSNSVVAATAAALLATSTTSQIVNLTRQHGGDIFNTIDNSRCDMDTCVGLSSGTAGLYKTGNKETDMANGNYKVNNDNCRCQCLPHLDTFREDLNICVDDIHECTLAPFVSGSTSEKIPFVFLPLRGQIIHPSKEINFQGVKAPVCAVSGAQYLTTIGWTELRNPIDSDVPFRLFRDEGRTFLQWLGESDLRYQMQGRLVLVHLMCRDMAPISREALLTVDIDAGRRAIKPRKIIQNLFSPCVAFRVVGTPVKHTNNVTEVSFQSEATLSSITSNEGLTAKEYILIAVCSFILGLIYVASVFLYIHVKRYKSRLSTTGQDAETDGGNVVGKTTEYAQNDQVKYGQGFGRSGNYNRSITSTAGLSERRLSGSTRKMSSLSGLGTEEQGVVKSNPLLKHYPNLSDNSGFTSDMSTSNSECDDERAISHEIITKNMQNATQGNCNTKRNENSPNASQETECLPEANVSIIEDMTTEDKLENMKAIVNGTMRRKLYFNPAYFEPHLLMSPPPAAVEFLAKIREVITMAKYKMAAKRFQPSLIVIPEERAPNGIESKKQQEAAAASATSNIKVDDARKKSCAGCPGCCEKNDMNASTSNCKNCGDKRNSIRKWLEGVSKHENDLLSESDEQSVRGKNDTDDGDSCKRGETSKTNDSSSSSDTDTVKANSIDSKSSKKRQAPPIPTVGPKVISHAAKKEHMHAATKNEIIKPKTAPPAPPKTAPYDVVAAAEIYNNLSMTGSEIYNNPQFMHSSPPLSQRSRTSRHSHNTNRSFKKHIEVMDQYANPNLLRQNDAAAKPNLHQMPDMVYVAIAKDYSTGKRSSIDKRTHEVYSDVSLPTPDYDDPSNSTYSRKRNNNYASSEGTLIPPPDYNNTLGRRQYQPDSPIYRRKSPHHLIVDYETDSLERTNTNRTNRNLMAPHSNNSSDLSSHPSPSLSSALPLEEEVEVRNTVYDRVEGYRKDGDPIKTITVVPKTQSNKTSSIYEDIASVSNAYMMSRRSSLTKEPIIKYNTPFHGSMTIEVDHAPTDDELSTDSDQFEPDTLDRKPKKINNATNQTAFAERFHDIPNNQRNMKAWPNENLNSLPDMNCVQQHNNVAEKVPSQVVLRSSGSFKSNSLGSYLNDVNAIDNDTNADSNFCSLREIYAAKNQKNLLQRPSFTEHDYNNGRLLTLEARHSRRQRETTLEKNMRKALPPDIIPNGKNVFVHRGKFETNKNNEKMIQKNLLGWNTDDGKMQKKKRNDESDEYGGQQQSPPAMVSETMSNSSNSGENTDVTGVSDTHANSESNSVRAYSEVRKISAVKPSTASPKQCNNNNTMANEKCVDGNLYVNLSDLRCIKTDQSDCNSDSSTLKTGSTKFYYKSNLHPPPPPPNNNNNNNIQHGKGVIVTADDLDRIEILSSNSLKLKDMNLPRIVDTSAKDFISELANDTSGFNPLGSCHPTKVFHVDVSSTSPTNGMQIALGIRDRVKKSKDLKNAWKKFVNLAASKFPGTSSSSAASPPPKSPNIKGEYDLSDKLSTEGADRDDGIASMHTFDDNMTVSSSSDTKSSIEILSRSPSSSSSSDIATQRPNKNEMDYGYISADSNDSRVQHKKLYERFNFKANKNLAEPSTSKSALGEIDCFAHKMPLNRMQDIKENAENDRNSPASLKCIKQQPMKVAPKLIDMPRTKLNDYVPKNSAPMVPTTDAINVRIYSSSDEDRYSSGMSCESDEEGNLDEMCESDAESVETHSVFFKNIRKTRDNNKP